MKKLITITFLLLFTGTYAQTLTMMEFEDADALEEFNKANDHADANELKSLSTKRMSVSEQELFNSRLLKKADALFDKMWYSEAAELYDIALAKNADSEHINLLQRAGDAHYFNSNMDMAYQWYSKLYKLYQEELSEEELFKYAHILKGTGRYRQAKRLLRIFRKNNSKQTLRISEKELLAKKAEFLKKSIEVKNLDVNTKYSDFSPMVLEKDKLVFASSKDSSIFNTRRYKWNNQPYLDLFVGKVGESSDKLKDVTKLSKNVNSKYHEAAVSFSPDNNTMYFTRNNYGKKLKRDKNGINHLKIYMSQKQNGEWSKAKELPFNSENFSSGHPAVSDDGKKLYFVSDRPGGFGGTDIYVVDILENGAFSEPKNLGKAINTSKKEMFPFVTEGTIYFSSDRALGLGGLDVYKANFVGNTFEVATNLGEPINSNRDDFSYIINETTKKGYFASNRKGGKGDDDIYSFKHLTVDKYDNSTILVGTVTELVSGNVIPNATITLLDKNGATVRETISREDGSFIFDNIESGTAYSVSANNLDYLENTQKVKVDGEDRIELNIELAKPDEMIVYEKNVKKIKTEAIYFGFDKHGITPSAKKELDKLVDLWDKYPEMVIKIESHTDSRGSRSYNQYLSDKRAQSTKEYLLSKGVSPLAIASAKGYGEDRPVNNCKDGVKCASHNHKSNRRSEFIIVNL